MSNDKERLAMFRDCLLAVAPVFARDAIRRYGTILGDVYDPTDQSEAVTDQRRKVASETATLATQLALHLASNYAEFYEAVAPETKDAAAAREESYRQALEAGTGFKAAKDPAAKVQRGQT